jgi:hypothetical protein
MLLERFTAFDLKPKYAYLVLVILLSGYLIVTIPEIFQDECSGYFMCFDHDRRMSSLYTWNFHDDFWNVHYLLLIASNEMTGKYSTFVLISSFLLLCMTYLFTSKITGKRYAGLVAVMITLQSSIFYNYDTSVTYPSFWCLLYISALYFTITNWKLSIPLYALSIPAKALTASFLPASIAFIAFSNVPRKQKWNICIGFTLVFVLGFAFSYMMNSYGNPSAWIPVKFNSFGFIEGLGSWANSFRDDHTTFVLLFVVLFGMIALNKVKVPYTKSIAFCIILILAHSVFLRGLTTYDTFPYRLLPIVSLISIGFGVMISNIPKLYSSLKLFKK